MAGIIDTSGSTSVVAAHVPAAAGRGVRLPQLRLHGGGAGHGVVCVCVCVYVYMCGPVLRGVFRYAAAQ